MYSLIATLLAGLVMLMMGMRVLRRFTKRIQEPPRQPSFDLAELQSMLDGGLISHDEYERLKSLVVAQRRRSGKEQRGLRLFRWPNPTNRKRNSLAGSDFDALLIYQHAATFTADITVLCEAAAVYPPFTFATTEAVFGGGAKGGAYVHVVVAADGLGADLATFGFPAGTVTIAGGQRVGDFMEERIADLFGGN